VSIRVPRDLVASTVAIKVAYKARRIEALLSMSPALVPSPPAERGEKDAQGWRGNAEPYPELDEGGAATGKAVENSDGNGSAEAAHPPPNAGDYITDVLVSPKLWPRATLGWSIAYNTELVKNPPKSWMDLTKLEYNGMIGEVIGPSGGTTWTRIMFERQVLGEEYWKNQAATKVTLYPSGAPLSDALVRGEVAIAPLLYNIIWTKKKDGAPVEIFFPPEGVPINPYASGIPKAASHPNAARLFLNWNLSEEGQSFMIKELGNVTSLKTPPAYPEGWDPKVVKVWVPNFDQYQKLHATWMEEWNKTYGYRQ
jgi:iron(III) transport system substrate-binding protein